MVYNNFAEIATSFFLRAKLSELPSPDSFANIKSQELKVRCCEGRICLLATRGGLTGLPILVLSYLEYKQLCGLGDHLVKVSRLYNGLPLGIYISGGKLLVPLPPADFEVKSLALNFKCLV